MANICKLCMANMDLVGRVHNCVPVLAAAHSQHDEDQQEREQDAKATGVHGRSAYKYRDPEKRRAYMREYMSRRRKAAK